MIYPATERLAVVIHDAECHSLVRVNAVKICPYPNSDKWYIHHINGTGTEGAFAYPEALAYAEKSLRRTCSGFCFCRVGADILY